jgi:hypothetical protein
MNRINRFEALKNQFPKEPTDYEDFEDIAPYNKLEDGKWTSLWRMCHPIGRMIIERFSSGYDGKLLWSELKEKKEEIEKLWKYLGEYNKEWPEIPGLRRLVREQEKLCGEECAQKLQKHLDVCPELNEKYKCSKNFVSYICTFKENGRCSHYYEIKRASEEIENYEYDLYEYKDRIMDLECEYERALAVKEDRLKEYLDDLYDSC